MTHYAARLRRESTVLYDVASVAEAAQALTDAPLRALPVVDQRERFVGVFGEREFLRALFPGYISELRSAAFVPAELDETIEHRAASSQEPIRQFITKDHVEVPPDASDLQLAETFLNHRVLILPVIQDGRVAGVIDREEFFRALAGDFLSRLSPD